MNIRQFRWMAAGLCAAFSIATSGTLGEDRPLPGREVNASPEVSGGAQAGVPAHRPQGLCAGETVAAGKEVSSLKEHRSGNWSPELTEAEQTTLFAIANDTLHWCVAGGRGAFPFDRYTLTPRLHVDRATFVTLKIHGMLRGCIGSLAPMAPLYQSIHENAVSAALHDQRFPPVSPNELDKIDVHISVLSPITEIASLDEFKIGAHGIILEKGRYRAVYLPEVAVEQNWTLEETLSSLSLKAGMSADGWRQGAKFRIFSSVAISKE